MRRLVVVSADEDVAGRIRRIGSDFSLGLVEWVSDPVQLRAHRPVEDELAGLVLDLSSPAAIPKDTSLTRPNSTQSHPQTDLTWRLAALLATARGYADIPLIVVGIWNDLAPTLRAGGLDAIGWIPLNAGDTFWRTMLRRLIEAKAPVLPPRAAATRSSAAGEDEHVLVRIGPHVLLDGPACALRRGLEVIPLTARELALLELLLAAPARYHRLREIARCLTPPGKWEVDEHSIEQTISRLRRKLGESVRRPCLLRCKRGVGYGLFPGSGGDTAET
ncbi:MAG TPA: helix-turn-helix domain-containing protein [Ktedonobacterales bacterium]|nr:helix-turn-helix domain-containing protein [Ktedonobacterales bacterium]